jgi:hypothetical protein
MAIAHYEAVPKGDVPKVPPYCDLFAQFIDRLVSVIT